MTESHVRRATAEGSSLTNQRLAEAFLERARARLEALDSLRDEADLSDVIREARDIVDLCFRSMLRVQGIEATRWMDIGEVMRRNLDHMPSEISENEDRILGIYENLATGQRSELAGAALLPSEKLLLADADRSIADAEWILEMAQLTIDIISGSRVPIASGG